MIRGQIASDVVMNVSSYPESYKKLDKLKMHLCSLAYPAYPARNGRIYHERCRECMCCGYGRRALELIEQQGQPVHKPKKLGRPKGSKTKNKGGKRA